MQQMKILIADADIESRQQLAGIISGARPDVRLRFADTGRALFKVLQEETFDMLFLDMVLPLYRRRQAQERDLPDACTKRHPARARQ